MRLALLTLFIVASIGACSEDAGEQLRGVVIDIDSAGLGDVRSFTLKDLDENYEIYIDPIITYEFPVSHLSAHRAAAESIVVDVETRDGRLYALAITDG